MNPSHSVSHDMAKRDKYHDLVKKALQAEGWTITHDPCRSDVDDLEDVLGQYVLYREIMKEIQIERELFLAIPHRTFTSLFQIPVGMVLLQHHILNLLVYDEKKEVITEWIHT